MPKLICLALRLSTVVGCNQILVLEAGEVKLKEDGRSAS